LLYEGKCKWSYGPSCPMVFSIKYIHSFIHFGVFYCVSACSYCSSFIRLKTLAPPLNLAIAISYKANDLIISDQVRHLVLPLFFLIYMSRILLLHDKLHDELGWNSCTPFHICSQNVIDLFTVFCRKCYENPLPLSLPFVGTQTNKKHNLTTSKRTNDGTLCVSCTTWQSRAAISSYRLSTDAYVTVLESRCEAKHIKMRPRRQRQHQAKQKLRSVFISSM